jgi:hypothetical protein
MTAHWLAPAGLHTAAARLPVEGEPSPVTAPVTDIERVELRKGVG